jgi:hypothetical protein
MPEPVTMVFSLTGLASMTGDHGVKLHISSEVMDMSRYDLREGK